MSFPDILIVDDEVQTRSMLNEHFSKRIECKIFEAGDGYKALEILKNNNIDLMLIDIKMPGISGIEVIEKIRQSSKDLSVIVLSKFEGEEVIEKIKGLGADFVNKPFSLKVVREKAEEKLKALNKLFPKHI